MTISSNQLRRSRLGSALVYWVFIPAAVVLGGKTTDLLLDLPPLSSLGYLPVILAIVLIGTGVFLIQRATIDLKHHGGGSPNPQAPPVRLVTEGSFSLCRHPMFLGYDLAALGSVLLFRSFGMLIIAYPVFIALQVRFLKKRRNRYSPAVSEPLMPPTGKAFLSCCLFIMIFI